MVPAMNTSIMMSPMVVMPTSMNSCSWKTSFWMRDMMRPTSFRS